MVLYGDWEKTRDQNWFPWNGRYEEMYADKISQLSKIFQNEKNTDLEQRVKQATVMFGYSLSQKKFPIRLILLCSGLESLVVKEREAIGEKLSERIPVLVEDTNKTDVKGLIKKLYLKRSRVVHSKLSDTITKQDIQICQKYLFQSIEKILNLIDEGYSSLESDKDQKSLMDLYTWKMTKS